MKTELTVEESARLIELGVDPKMASNTTITDYDLDMVYYAPRFSVGDLINILPKEIDGYHLSIEATDDGYDVAYILYNRNDGLLFLGAIPTAPELIDSLYSLLIWAIENGHVKTNKDN